MTYFNDENLLKLRTELNKVPNKLTVLQELFLQREFRNERAKEFAHHGYIRRLNILARCVENVFALIPPDRTEPVAGEVRRDAEIQIQTSVFNVFGAADNLAWIWVSEKAIRRADGSEIPQTWIGLRSMNQEVRASLPQALGAYVAGLDAWFDMVDGYRHALAHRIPLYVPPFTVDHTDVDRYQDLERRKIRALLDRDLAEHERLEAEQKTLEIFRPWMQHSFGEQARPLVFHPQLLANFNTIEEMGRKFAEALDA